MAKDINRTFKLLTLSSAQISGDCYLTSKPKDESFNKRL